MNLPITNKEVKKYKRKIDNRMHAFGDTDLDRKVIRINKKKSKKTGRGEVLDTIVHEVSHVKHPNMKEKNIRKHTKKLIKNMTRTNKQRHYKLF